MSETWITGFGKEFGNPAYGDDKTVTTSLNVLHVIDLEDIRNIPPDCIVTYTYIAVDFGP